MAICRFILIIISIFVSVTVNAVDSCKALFENTKFSSYVSERDASNLLSKSVLTSTLERAKQQLFVKEFHVFREWYLSHFYFDRREILIEALKDPNLTSPQMYTQKGQDPFLGYMFAREKIASWPIEKALSIEGMGAIQKMLLEAHSDAKTNKEYGKISTENSEGTVDKDLGNIRYYAVLNLIQDKSRPLGGTYRANYSDKYKNSENKKIRSQEIIDQLSASLDRESQTNNPNPFDLTHLDDNSIHSPRTYHQLEKENEYLSKGPEYVEYAGIENWKKYKNKLSEHVRLRLEIADNERLFERPYTLAAKLLRIDFLRDLVQYELAQFSTKMKQGYKSKEQKIELIAELYWKLVSIHPFANGNGRTFRLILERLLSEYGIYPPIWTHIGEDAYRSLGEFARILKDSIYLSELFHSEINSKQLYKLKDLKSALSYILLPPNLLKQYYLSQDSYPVTHIFDIGSMTDFAQFCKLHGKKVNRYLVDEYFKMKLGMNKKVIDTNGLQKSITFIPEAYTKLFNRFSRNHAEYDLKVNFYDQQYIYRGAAIQEELTINRAVKTFIEITKENTGTGVLDDRQDVMSSIELFNAQLAKEQSRLKSILSIFNGNTEFKAYWNSLLSSWTTDIKAAEKHANGKYLNQPEKGFTVLLEAYTPIYGAYSAHAISNSFGTRIKESQKNDYVVVGAVLPEMIQRARFYKLAKPKKFWNRFFNAKLSQEDSDLIIVTRVSWNELSVVEVNSQDSFLTQKKYRVYIKPMGGFEIIEVKDNQQ